MGVSVKASVKNSINYAAFHCGIPFLENIVISGAERTNVICRITSVPEFIYEFKKEIALTGGSATLAKPDIHLNDAFYRHELVEGQDGEIKIDILNPDNMEKVLGFGNFPVHIQAYQHWDGYNYPQTMAAFLQPNDPLIGNVLKRAGEYAAAAGESMCGYQCRSKEGVRRQASYIYRALADCGLHYISSPASFEPSGQKIRIPHHTLHETEKQGTCLDLAILYATCMEAASINSVIVVIPGHAFAGVWLEAKSFSKGMVSGSAVTGSLLEEMKKNFIPVECTTFTDNSKVTFEQAVEIGNRNLTECSYVIDVAASRDEGYVPIYTYVDQPICGNGDDAGYENEKSYKYEEFSKEHMQKIDRLREQAMDLSTRSRMISGNQDDLDIILPVNSAELVKDGISDEDLNLLLSKVPARKKKKQNDVLHQLYISSRQTKREKGKSNLYLTINEMKWKQPGNDKVWSAVVYLCPAEIYRNRKAEYQLRIFHDQIRFNPVLKALLSQEFYLDSSMLSDQPGAEYASQMQQLRFLIDNQKAWSVVENTARLGLFTIPDEAVWKSLFDENVLNHEIVKGILKGTMTWENNLQRESDEKETIYAFQADSSQSSIVDAAFSRKTQVVIGPAGNGKTQTIVNTMTEAIRKGERVLFVSEKAPALEVANEMMKSALNGLFTLMIINGQQKPADVVSQIRHTLDYIEISHDGENSDNVLAARKRYGECVEYISRYYELMKKKNACGKSLEELIEMFEKYRDCPVNLVMDDRSAAIPLADAEGQMRTFADALAYRDHAKGKYTAFIRYDNLAGNGEEKALKAAEAALQRFDVLQKEMHRFTEAIDYPVLDSEKELLQHILPAGKMLLQCPVMGDTVDNILNHMREQDENFREKLFQLVDKYEKNVASSWKSKSVKKDILKMLEDAGMSRNARRDFINDLERDAEACRHTIRQMNITIDDEGGTMISPDGGDVANLQEYMHAVRKAVGRLSEAEGEAILKAVNRVVEGKSLELKERGDALVQAYQKYLEAQKEAEAWIINDAEGFAKRHPDQLKKVLFEEWIENRKVDKDINQNTYNKIVTRAEKMGLANIINQIEDIGAEKDLSSEDVLGGFYKSWCVYHIQKCQEENHQLEEFDYFTYNEKVRQYKESEELVREGVRRAIVHAQIDRMPNIQEGVSNNREFGILQSLVRRDKTAIRSFFEQAPEMLMNICPCMLMDPSSVAEYIPSEFPKFDLVIIDEGSQMPTYRALAPISHGWRCMIFGDEKQLKPMDFFKKKQEEDGLSMAPESILTDAITTSMPRKTLRFHYRSEHESLIAFSNKKYYNGDIITFPACDTNVAGVTYEYVENGVYDKSGKRINEPEAKRVVEKIKEIYAGLPEGTTATLGVITLNIQQRNLIRTMLLQEMVADKVFGSKADEYVSVVNLESCQGKEWDHVILSPGYGPDKIGKFTNSLGALNREDGMNRLNVMISRSKKSMHVITSIDPSMLSGSENDGIRDFREFLAYAKGEKVFDSRVKNSAKREPGLISSIAKALEEKGYEVHTNIGSSQFKVDIGIVSPENKEKYILGILVDNFQIEEKDIRDREVIYPEALKQKGWKVYRLHALSWYQDSQHEIRQIIKTMQGKG